MNKHLFTYKHGFALEAGGELTELKIAYHTDGTLSTTKDNVVMVCHAFSASSDVSDWWSGLYGHSKLFDPIKDFILCPNIIGSPYGSSSPHDINPVTGKIYGKDFPLITVRDQVKAYALLLESLGITKIKLLIGGSYGGHQAQELAYSFEGEIAHLVLLCTAARESAWNIAIHEAQRLALMSDSSFDDYTLDAGRDGLRAARGMGMLNYRTDESYRLTQTDEDETKLNDFKASSYIRYQGEKMCKRFNAHSYYALMNSLDTHNIGRHRGGVEKALSKINSPTTVIGFTSDQLIPTSEQKFLAEHLPNAKYHEIDTAYGHDGFLVEVDEIMMILL